ncbi:MAG: hypothetical protein U0S48_20310 [Solirubrobacteraceae bacterium]
MEHDRQDMARHHVGELLQRGAGVRPVPLEDARGHAEHVVCEQERVLRREPPVAHPPVEEARPVTVEVACVGPRLGQRRALLARPREVLVEPADLGLEDPEAQHAGLVQREDVADRRADDVHRIAVRAACRLEVVAVVAQGLGHDREQAVRLGGEVVVQRGLADPHRLRHVGPLRQVVAELRELMRRRVDDGLALGARTGDRSHEPYRAVNAPSTV